MKFPKYVQLVLNKFEENGFEAYVVGGCVRDSLRGAEPKDWDVTTNATPVQICNIFPQHYADNRFGTVTVQIDEKEIEVTPYRTESKYTDKRHPDRVEWAETIDQDLSRRDFTVNAMAFNAKKELLDPFNGQKDLKARIIRAVGDPNDRFSEDALRMLRAARFATVLDWQIEDKTRQAIKKNVGLLAFISKERIRDELLKIVMAEKAADGIELLRSLGLLKYILPEVEQGYKVSQNKHHIYDVYTHCLFSLKYAAKKDFNKYVRFAALFHDVGKPKTKRGKGADATFYNHEVVGAEITDTILRRLKFSKKEIKKIVKLVRYHLFYYNVGEVGEASIRRLVKNVGMENIEELIQLRMCDRIGSGCPKAEPYKLRHFRYLIDKVSSDPIMVNMLKINGNDIIKMLRIKPGPKIGQILNILLSRVLDDPSLNTSVYLSSVARELSDLSPSDLEKTAEKAKKKKKQLEIKKDEMTKKKYWIS